MQRRSWESWRGARRSDRALMQLNVLSTMTEEVCCMCTSNRWCRAPWKVAPNISPPLVKLQAHSSVLWWSFCMCWKVHAQCLQIPLSGGERRLKPGQTAPTVELRLHCDRLCGAKSDLAFCFFLFSAHVKMTVKWKQSLGIFVASIIRMFCALYIRVVGHVFQLKSTGGKSKQCFSTLLSLLSYKHNYCCSNSNSLIVHSRDWLMALILVSQHRDLNNGRPCRHSEDTKEMREESSGFTAEADG